MIQFLSTESVGTVEMIVSLLPMIVIILVLFLVVYLPQKRQDKKDAAMRNSIEIGDKVTTKDDTIVVETGSDRTKIRFRRTAISNVEKLDVGDNKTPAAKNAASKK